MSWRWWGRGPVDIRESCKALEDSQQSLAETRKRWHRVNELAARADQANRKVQSQREQNHLAEIVRAALLGGKNP